MISKRVLAVFGWSVAYWLLALFLWGAISLMSLMGDCFHIPQCEQGKRDALDWIRAGFVGLVVIYIASVVRALMIWSRGSQLLHR